MSREKKIQFNVNEKEYERLKSHAESEGLSMAEVLRDYIKTLTILLSSPDCSVFMELPPTVSRIASQQY
ncbi:ribbon-helix-helix protein, CopG family [Planktothrix rubescens]|uniref:ribbon-helix-helix protein, CopG family n=1 Tax=Planktothrix rubescens TaxID=59512 RepID=UPI0005C611ED|nr:ribbon-helix-helix protein, CopG family [Planktothrix rubescens]